MSPITREGLFTTNIEDIDVNSSGSDVTAPSKTEPIKAPETLVFLSHFQF